MNKKIISILMIIGLLLVSLASLTANQTSDETTTESAEQPSDTSNDVFEDASDESTQEDNLDNNQTDTNENVSENESNTQTVASGGVEDNSESISAVSDGIYHLTQAENLRFYYELNEINDKGQYDNILMMLENHEKYTPKDFADAFNKLSDEDYDNMAMVFEFSHDDYQSDSSRYRTERTIDVIDDFIDLDNENGESFTDILVLFNDGRFDTLIAYLEDYKQYDAYDLYDELSQLSDEDFEILDKFIQLLDTYDGDDESEDTSIITNITGKASQVSTAKGDGQHSSPSMHSKISQYKSQKIFSKERTSRIDLSKISLIDELLYRYFAGEITFNQLVNLLEDNGIDTSDLKQNPDGSLSWFGLNSILSPDMLIPDDLEEMTASDSGSDMTPNVSDSTDESDYDSSAFPSDNGYTDSNDLNNILSANDDGQNEVLI